VAAFLQIIVCAKCLIRKAYKITQTCGFKKLLKDTSSIHMPNGITVNFDICLHFNILLDSNRKYLYWPYPFFSQNKHK